MMLMIQGKMGVLKKINCLVFLVILLCVSLAVTLDYRVVGEEAFLNQLVDPATGEIDENLAELLWTSCRQDLNDLMDAFEDPKLHLLEETPFTTNDIDTTGHTLAKENIQKLINVLGPQLKRALSYCIRKNNLIFQASGDDRGFKTWYTRYFEALFHWHDVPRRILAPQSIAIAPTLNLGRSPAPAPSPFPSISISPAPVPAPTPSAASEAPDFSPNPSQSPASSPSPLPIRPHQSAPSINDPLDNLSPANEDSDNKGTDNSKTLIIACVITAVVTSFVAALLFILCCRGDSKTKQNNEMPILGLSLGSSNAYAFGSNKEEKLDHQSFGNESSLHEKASSNGNVYIDSNALQISLDGKSSFGAVSGAAKALVESSDTSGNTHLLLPLPPGRVNTSPPGLPPLNSLPGRADPLPPEPPDPIKASPSPPPPPAPPFSMKPASANVPRPPGPPPPPIPTGVKPGPQPSAPPRPPPSIPLGSKGARPPSGPQQTPNAISGNGDDANAPKAKLKPFFWDKVAAKPDHSMVWNQIKSGSFQFNEEMIETLFGYGSTDKNRNDGKKEPSTQDPVAQHIQLLDHKKAQNLAILLRALNVTTEEVCDALHEGKELPVGLLQTLLKMAPTADEELKLRLFSGEISQLGPAEQFLKVLIDIPFAFKRMETLLFMCSLHEEVAVTRESFETLEVACKELRSSRLFLKLLEAVLKTGNRMNDGTFHGGAQAFKLDTLLKLSDVKGTDGKTTLLHFVVQEIIRTEGLKAARVSRESKSFNSINSSDLLEDVSPDTEEHYRSLGFQAVSRLSSELENVKKAAALDAENLTGTVAKLGEALLKARDFLNSEMKSIEEERGFRETLEIFVQNAEANVMSLLEEEKRIMALVKSTGNYFHGNAQKDEGIRLFVIIRDFLIILDKVCKEVRDAPRKPVKSHKNPGSGASSSSESHIEPLSPNPRQKLFPAIAERRMEDSSSSSDDES